MATDHERRKSDGQHRETQHRGIEQGDPEHGKSEHGATAHGDNALGENDAETSDDERQPGLTGAELDALFERPARPRFRMGVGAGVILALVALAVGLVVAALQPSPSTVVGETPVATELASPDGGLPGEALGSPEDTEVAPGGGAGSAPPGDASPSLLVHVVGAVSSPGVVALAPGSRVIDAVNAAGGLTAEADRASVNLARAVVDGEQLYVPRIGEEPPVPPDASGDAATSGAGGDATSGAGTAAGAADASGGAAGGLINLNTATQAELETLPRIGPAMAQRILDYRDQNGGFTSVDELKEVSGIGDATFEALSPLVTV